MTCISVYTHNLPTFHRWLLDFQVDADTIWNEAHSANAARMVTFILTIHSIKYN